MQLSFFAEAPRRVRLPTAPTPTVVLTRRQAERDARHRDAGIALDAMLSDLPCDAERDDDGFCPRPGCECMGWGDDPDEPDDGCIMADDLCQIDATDPADWTPAYAAGVIAAAGGLDDFENPYCPHRASADFADWRAGRDLQPPVYRP
jgi:hypothetical protein